jgi:GT2 family glycosyltransferase
LWHLQDGAVDPLARKSSESFDAAIRSSQGRTKLIESSDSRSVPRISIVICSRNAKLLDKCLKNLRITLKPGDEIVVVAHLQGDMGLEKVANAHGARVVLYRGPFHFGLMNRLGVEAAAAPMICLMNDDVTPVTQDWLSIMLAQASHPDVGIVGALLLYPDGTIEHAGIAVGGRHLPAHVGRHQKESPYWLWLRVTREVTAVTGACMLMRRAVWNDLGGFDIRFPVNFNDVDLCLRAIERGYKNILEARAILNHAGSQTRIPMVHGAEHELLYKLWWRVLKEPDRFFNPQLRNTVESISLGSVDYP